MVALSSTTSDVFNAIAEGRRREILDMLITGEKAVGTIVADLAGGGATAVVPPRAVAPSAVPGLARPGRADVERAARPDGTVSDKPMPPVG